MPVMTPPHTHPDRTWLDVPYADNDHAKTLGMMGPHRPTLVRTPYAVTRLASLPGSRTGALTGGGRHRYDPTC
jgi:hypothetical protein